MLATATRRPRFSAASEDQLTRVMKFLSNRTGYTIKPNPDSSTEAIATDDKGNSAIVTFISDTGSIMYKSGRPGTDTPPKIANSILYRVMDALCDYGG